MLHFNFLLTILTTTALLLGPSVQATPLPVLEHITEQQQQTQSTDETSGKAGSSSGGDSGKSRPLETPLFPSVPSSKSGGDGWRDVLKRMTEEKPCGGEATYDLCRQCGELTGNKDAFYWCCLNTEDVRGFCESFVNYTIE